MHGVSEDVAKCIPCDFTWIPDASKKCILA